MSFDHRKLRGKIKETYGTQNVFAKELGIGRVSLSHRLNNICDFTRKEIDRASDLLAIPKEDIPNYFFCVDSSENRTND